MNRTAVAGLLALSVCWALPAAAVPAEVENGVVGTVTDGVRVRVANRPYTVSAAVRQLRLPGDQATPPNAYVEFAVVSRDGRALPRDLQVMDVVVKRAHRSWRPDLRDVPTIALVRDPLAIRKAASAGLDWAPGERVRVEFKLKQGSRTVRGVIETTIKGPFVTFTPQAG
ncbi:MAG TPA: hypothetical protein VD971_11585 [Phycisphaerales bacterium]|nr:hypothetical protein [Phycisphaerales bacterium]